MKIITGAGKTVYHGWISTQENELNLLSRADFECLFSKEKPTAFLAEHVWEHMTLEEGITAAKNCYDYLAELSLDGKIEFLELPGVVIPNCPISAYKDKILTISFMKKKDEYLNPVLNFVQI